MFRRSLPSSLVLSVPIADSPLSAVSPSSTGSLAFAARILLAVGAGVLATLAMDLVMARIEEGETPPRVASGVLTATRPDDAPRRLAAVVHYVAGALSGPLYLWLVFVAEGLLGGGLVAGLVAAIVFYPLMVGFFVAIVLPRSRGLTRERRRAVGRAWALEAAAYVVVLAPLVSLTSVLV